jgi:hypothetical protein
MMMQQHATPRTIKPRRTKSRRNEPLVSVLGFERMTRTEAVERVCRLLRRALYHPAAERLMVLFNISLEELLEGGLSYEQVKVLARRGFF